MNTQANDSIRKPLVTLYILSYNRFNYIRSALESAFAQTYSPLEIVISDNCSTDGSYEIILDMVGSYKGNHHIILNRNEKNIGLIGNVCKAFSLAKGELLVMQCDDDISVPNRVDLLVTEWCRFNKQPYVVCSSYTYMRSNGTQENRQGFFWSKTEIEQKNICDVLRYYSYRGSSAAYRPEVMTKFGDIVNKGCYDDIVLFSRGRLLGDILLVKDSLLLYREGGISANTGTVESAFLKKAHAEKASYLQILRDIDVRWRQHALSNELRNKLVKICQTIIEENECRIKILDGNLSERFSAYRQLKKKPEGQPKFFLLLICFCPPKITRGLVWFCFRLQKLRGKFWA